MFALTLCMLTKKHKKQTIVAAFLSENTFDDYIYKQSAYIYKKN